MDLTIFSPVDNYKYQLLKAYGFFYEDNNYINVFRWIWNELHIHPNLESFFGNADNKTMITFNNPYTHKTDKLFAIGYDEAIIKSVEYFIENINNYISK